MKNKEILMHCPNFYKINDFEFNENDFITKKLIEVYKEYIFSIDLSDFAEVRRIESLDTALSKYIDDYTFRKEMKSSLKSLKVKKDDNIILSIVDFILKVFERYEEGFTRNIYISRWI